MTVPENSKLVIVGRVVKSHGVRGEIKVAPETDDPGRFFEFEAVFVGNPKSGITRHVVDSVRFQPSKRGLLALVSLEGVNDRDEADRLVKSFVYVHEEDLSLASDEYFLHDLIGCEVTVLNATASGGTQTGVVKDILEMPAHDVFVVSISGRPDVMIPAIEAFIEDIDLVARRIVLRSIEGLLDL